MSEMYVDVGELRAHANHVLQLSSKAGQATAAAEQVAFTPTMFGSIGSILVSPFMVPLQAAGVLATHAVEGALGDTGESIKMLADAFEAVDNTIGEHFDWVGRKIR